jgi:hypothetical protein
MNYRLDNKEAESSKSLEMERTYSLKTTSNEAKGYLEYAKGWILVRNNKTTEAVTAYLKAINYLKIHPQLLHSMEDTEIQPKNYPPFMLT